MSESMDKQKAEFDDFVSKWDQALEKGIFEKPNLPEVNPQTATGSFFGFTQTNNTDSVGQTDKEYWNAINIAADDHDPKVISEAKVIGTGNDSAYLSYVFSKEEIEKMSPEQKKDAARAIALARNEDRVEFQGYISREYKKRIVAYLNKIVGPDGKLKESVDHKSTPSNPVAKDTMGSDQDLSNQSLGMTFTEEEFKKLEELKKELFGLENKLMTSMGFGDDKNQKKLQTQIESVKKEINKLSTEMGRAFKNPDQPKHLENI